MASEATPVPPARRQTSLDQGTVDKLDGMLQKRPDMGELVERNILKDPSVAPALQAAREKLQRSQTEDKLAAAISQRPTPDELVKSGILEAGEVSIA